MMKQVMTKEHRQFLENCRSRETYLKYVRARVRNAFDFNEEELQTYHKAYTKLADSVESFNGSQFKHHIMTIMNSVSSYDERYFNYKKAIEEASELYNKVNVLHKSKLIKL